MSNQIYIEATIKINELIELCRAKLDSETIDAVQHYIKHDEFEMAFEGLFLDILIMDYWPEGLNIDNYCRVGYKLCLSTESVFDVNFWEKLMLFNTAHNTQDVCFLV